MADNQAPNPTSSTIPDPCHVPRWRLTGRRRLGAQLGMWHASSVGAHQRTWAWLRAVEQPLEVSWGPRYALWGDPWSYQACGARSAERSEQLGVWNLAGQTHNELCMEKSALGGVRMSTARRQIRAVVRLVGARLAGRPGSLGVRCCMHVKCRRAGGL